MAETQRGQDELGGHVGGGDNASRHHPPVEPAKEGSEHAEGRDQPPAEAIEDGTRDPKSPWLGGG